MTSEHAGPVQQLCEAFLSGNSPRFVFGTTPYAASILENIKVDGVIDDFTGLTEFSGVPVVKLSSVPDNAIVVSAIVDGRPVTINRLLQSKGLQTIDFFSFKNTVPFPLKECAFVPSPAFREEYASHSDKYQQVFARLADDASRETFKRLVDFRLNENLAVMEYFSFRPQESYFEPFVELRPGSTFIDAGSFDGETSRQFIRCCPDYRSIHIFEPEPGQIEAIRHTFKDTAGVTIHACGVSNKKETLTFTSSGSWSHLDENGDIQIYVDTIDGVVDEPVTFIKMDIEGHEYAALEGARKTIMTHHPALAICAYHRVDDFWKLPELVFSMRADYKLYMRHYTEGVLETVFYFIPQ